MARIWSSGFESNSASANVEWSSVAGSPTVQGTTVRSGGYALQITGMTSATSMRLSYTFVSAVTSASHFFRTYFRYGTLPTADNRIIGLYDVTAGTAKVFIDLSSTGTLELNDEDGVIGSVSSALTVDTWYRVEIEYDRSGAGGTHVVKAKLDSVEFAAATNRNISSGIDGFRVGGNMASEAQTTGNWYFDDIAINDASGSFQNSYPGAGNIIHLRPTGAGDTTTWTKGGSAPAATNYQGVNEVPFDDNTTYNYSNVLNDTDYFNVTDSGLASYDTINVVAVGTRHNRRSAGGTNNGVFRTKLKKASGGTVYNGTNVTTSSSTFFSNAENPPRTYQLVLYQDPDAINWTNSTLDTTQVGYEVTTAADTGRESAVSGIWALVDYTPGVAGTTNSGFLGLM